MHKLNRICPICQQNGKETLLELRQINLTEAVYICEDRNCIYPIGFQWEYVQNNILEDSDDSSDDTYKLTSDEKISISNSRTNTLNQINSNSNKNITNKQSVKQTENLKDKVNIISNIVIENPEHLQIKNVKSNEIATKSTESVRKNSVRSNNKTKGQNFSGALPEAVVKNAKALSKYFSNTTNQPTKPKTSIKTVFDIIQQPSVKKPEVLTKIEKREDEEVLSEEATNLKINNKLVEHDYLTQNNHCDEVSSDDKYIDSFLNSDLTNPQETNELTETFDELLFSNEYKCNNKNQSLDLSEMDELLSFL